MQFVHKTGWVVVRKVAPGSKSERDAVCLETPDGDLILRRRGGHPYSDPELAALTGKRIEADGVVTNNTFILTRWTAVDADETGKV